MENNRLQFHAIVVVLLFCLIASSYSIVTPLFESPDELWHYPYVWNIAQTGSLPTQAPDQYQLWEHEGSQAPLYYLLAALLTFSIDSSDLPLLLDRNPHADIGRVTLDRNVNIIIHTQREEWPWYGVVLAIHVARFFSVLLATGTVWFVYKLGSLLYPKQPEFALAAMIFVAFNPMFVFIAGSVNNDNIITFTATLTIWQLVSLLILNENNVFSWWHFVWLGFLVGLTALSKLSGLGMLGLVVLTLLWLGWQQRSWRIALLGNSIITLSALMVAGWWYARNIYLYNDWSGTQTTLMIMSPRPLTPTMAQWLHEASGLLHSFWGVFGYFSILMPTPVYWVLNLLLISGLIGWLKILISKHLRKLVLPSLKIWVILIMWTTIIFLGLLWYTWLIPSSQGRLLFPAIAAIALLWATGWVVLMPQRLYFLHAILLAPLTLWVPYGVILPAYSQPQSIATLPPTAQPLKVKLGNFATLLGAEFPTTTIYPGDKLPLTLYWQSETPPTINYSVFIHLVDESDQIVAQRDLFPGLGNYPTSQWMAGKRFADRYVLQIPNTAFAPTKARFVVGLYNAKTGERLLTAAGDDNVQLGQIQIQARPGQLPNPQNIRFEDGISLVGYDLAQRRIAAGEMLDFTLHWQAQHPPTQDYKVFVHLIGDDAHKAAQQDRRPQDGAAPTLGWDPGATIVDSYQLQTDPNTPPGIYWLVVGLYRDDTGDLLPLLYNGSTLLQADSIRLIGVRITAN